MKKFLSTNVLVAVFIAAFVLVSFTNGTEKADESLTTAKVETTTVLSAYRVVYGSSADNIGYMVSKEMGQGWQPQGGISIRSSDGMYFQAMVK